MIASAKAVSSLGVLHKRLQRGMAVGFVCSFVALGLYWLEGLHIYELRTWDWRARIFSEYQESSEVVVQVYIDEYSLSYLRENSGISWPWPREAYGLMVDFFNRAGVRALAFDIMFSEPSSMGVRDDEVFASAVGESSMVVSALFLGEEEGMSLSWSAGYSGEWRGISESECSQALEGKASSASRAVLPVEEIGVASRGLGNVNVLADSDGVYRRTHLYSCFDGRMVPTLGLAAFLVGEETGVDVSAKDCCINIGGRNIPVDKEGRVLLRWPDHESARAYSAAAVIQSELRIREGKEPPLDPADFEDTYVLVGASARGLYDLRPTPVEPIAPGVFFHAALLQNVLEESFMKEISGFWGIILVLLLIFPISYVGVYVVGPYRSALLYPLFLTLPVVVSVLAFRVGYSINLLPLTAGVALSLALSNVLNIAIEGRQKRYIKNAFQQYLSPAVIEQLITNPERLTLGGERRDLTIFFSDLEGFTSISERLSPEDLTSLLNDYLSAMTDIIHDEGGTIDKYEGDAIIAFWNAPLEHRDHAIRGVRAAIRCQSELNRLQSLFSARAGRDLVMRIGMNTGPAVVGNMGSRTRFDYTMLGDAVNLAARLEGINKQFGTRTLIAETSVKGLDGSISLREVARVAVVGRSEGVTVYEPFEQNEYEERSGEIERFEEALGLYYEGHLAQAYTLFSELEDRDPVSSKYRERVKELMDNPPLQWDGIWVMSSK